MHAIIAGIEATNTASVQWQRGFGFEEVALFKQVGYKFRAAGSTFGLWSAYCLPPNIRRKVDRHPHSVIFTLHHRAFPASSARARTSVVFPHHRCVPASIVAFPAPSGVSRIIGVFPHHRVLPASSWGARSIGVGPASSGGRVAAAGCSAPSRSVSCIPL